MSFFFTIRKLRFFTMKKVLIIHLIMEVVFWKLGQMLLLEIQQYSNTGGFKPAWVEIACVEW